MQFKWVLALLVFFSFGLYAEVADIYTFSTPEREQRFYQLVEELRCPKCQNQNIADSSSVISIDLRNEVYRLLEDGRSDQQIKEFMVQRYGDYILYRPELSSQTSVLWFAPVVLLLVGLIIVFVIARRGRKKAQAQPLDAAQKARLEALLDKKDEAK